MSKQKGLPTTRKMRHDFQFVENLTARKSDAIGKVIPIEQIDLNPSQPREQVGDLSDLDDVSHDFTNPRERHTANPDIF